MEPVRREPCLQTVDRPLPGTAWRRVFDGLPAAVVLVDGDRRVVAANGAAEALLGAREADAVGSRPGELFRCVNASLDPAGCGCSERCDECLLRASVDQAIAGSGMVQREVRLTAFDARKGSRTVLLFLVSASALATEEGQFVALLLQDVTALHRLRGLIPICSGCKKIRRDDSAWEALEGYIQSRSHAEFTHSMCPDCTARFYPKFGPKG